MDRVAKVIGADVEVANFIAGLPGSTRTGDIASRLLLREIRGVPGYRTMGTGNGGGPSNGNGSAAPHVPASQAGQFDDPQDVGRRFLPGNGGSAYIDLGHLELCIPEVRSARDYVAAWHAMLNIARGALEAVNRKLRPGLRIKVLANNSDGYGHSFGGHLNLLLSRRAWCEVIQRKSHYLGYLASFQTSSIVFTGQGKVGAENGARPVDYQISQRADFFETLCGWQTTYARPIVNSRNEPLCGELETCPGARLHVIFYDTSLCHTSNFLKAGVLQIVAAMIEAGQVDVGLILEDPLQALADYSHDPSLRARARTLGGHDVTAVEHQLLLRERIARFVDRGGCEGVVPQAEQIVALYTDTLEKLKTGPIEALAGRLDWVLKLGLLRQAMRRRPGLSWQSPEIKKLDHLYASLDDDGLYGAMERAGAVERIVDQAEIMKRTRHPPEDTRAFTRAMLLRLGGCRITHVNWDRIGFDGNGATGERTVHLENPAAYGEAETGPLFQRAETLDDVLAALPTSAPLSARQHHDQPNNTKFPGGSS